jgi:hypothetical protein
MSLAAALCCPRCCRPRTCVASRSAANPQSESAALAPAPPLLQAYANSRGIGLVGDMPIYVGGQSADVWAHRDLFELQPDGTPALVRCAWGGDRGRQAGHGSWTCAGAWVLVWAPWAGLFWATARQ